MTVSEPSSGAGALRRGWTLAPIAALVAPIETANPAKSGPGDFFYVDIEAVDNVAARIATPKLLPRATPPSRARHVIRMDDVIISLVRPRLRNIAVVPPELDGQWASTAFCVCRPRSGIDARYLYYLFVQDKFLQAIKTYGDSPPSGHDEDLLATVIPVAPSNEQSRIADRIEELLTDLDSGVAALARVKRNLVRYRAAVLHSAVTGQLTAAWRERTGPPSETGEQLLQRILVERRRQWEERTLAKYQAEGKQPPKAWRDRYVEPFQSPSTSAANGDIPAAWARARLEQIGFISSGTTPKRGERLFWEGGTVPWVSSSVVNEPYVDSASEFVTETALEETSLKLYAVGTLLVAMYGEGKTRGKVTELRISATCNQALAAISLVHGGASSLQSFVKLCLTAMYEGLRREAVGGVQPNLNGELVARIDIPLPPASEQQEILALAQQRISQIDALESRVAAVSARAARLRQAILKAAFEGRLVMQDPSDEPASVLLERIRAASATPSAKSPRKESVRKTAKT